MTSVPVRLLILTSFLALVGCPLNPASVKPDEQFEQKVSQWIAEKEYGEALSALASVDPKHPDYPRLAEWRKKVEKQAAQYEADTLKQTDALIAKGDWAQALNQFDEAIDHLPRSTKLRDGLSALTAKQNALVMEQDRQLLLKRGQWLIEAQPHYANIARITPRDSDAQRQLANHEEEMLETGEKLAKWGLEAFEAERMKEASQLIDLAEQMGSSEPITAAVSKLDTWKRSTEQARRERIRKDRAAAEARAASKRKKFNQLIGAYKTALNTGELLKAQSLLEQAEKTNPDKRSLQAEKVELSKQIRLRIEKRYSDGIEHYSRSEFAQAVEAWQEVVTLDPNHIQAQENLERAKKVLEKLQQLRQKQS